MPEFTDPSFEPRVSVDTDGDNGDFIIQVGKRKWVLPKKVAVELSSQISYAVEFVELYARGPR